MKNYFVQVGDVYLTRFQKGKAYFGQSSWEASLYTLVGAKRQKDKLLKMGHKHISVIEYYDHALWNNA